MTKTKLREEYRKEIKELERKMLDAQKFAEKYPIWEDQILENKYTSEFTGQIANSHKGLYLGWGICRHFYRTSDQLTNYRGDLNPQYLWYVYINQVSIFGDNYADSGLYDIHRKVDVFFFDHLNTSFYATDDQIIALLDELADWYAKAKPINDEYRKELKKKNC